MAVDSLCHPQAIATPNQSIKGPQKPRMGTKKRSDPHAAPLPFCLKINKFSFDFVFSYRCPFFKLLIMPLEI